VVAAAPGSKPSVAQPNGTHWIVTRPSPEPATAAVNPLLTNVSIGQSTEDHVVNAASMASSIAPASSSCGNASPIS
jgi:hypothetical protein